CLFRPNPVASWSRSPSCSGMSVPGITSTDTWKPRSTWGSFAS
ncbi:MAG: hypothetical protein AVDCRST_MAG73-1983, partial [uncultured Thermomicrobiales bacterium]